MFYLIFSEDNMYTHMRGIFQIKQSFQWFFNVLLIE
jgi:hypothetical protein